MSLITPIDWLLCLFSPPLAGVIFGHSTVTAGPLERWAGDPLAEWHMRRRRTRCQIMPQGLQPHTKGALSLAELLAFFRSVSLSSPLPPPFFWRPPSPQAGRPSLHDLFSICQSAHMCDCLSEHFWGTYGEGTKQRKCPAMPSGWRWSLRPPACVSVSVSPLWTVRCWGSSHKAGSHFWPMHSFDHKMTAVPRFMCRAKTSRSARNVGV